MSSSFRVVRYVLAVAVVAVLAAAFAVAFRAAINFVFSRIFHARDVLALFEHLSWQWCLAVPAIGGALAGTVSVLSLRLFRGQSVGDVMEAVALGNHPVSLRAAALKVLGSFVAIASGGSIGREGPIIQFGGGLGDAISRLSRLSASEKRTLIAAGTAAGFAAAYNTPLAAVLFVVEIVTGVITLEIVLPALFATGIATTITRIAIGGGPIYGERTFSASSNVELVALGVLGVLAGFAGPAFMALLDRGEALFDELRLPKPLAAGLGGLGVGVIAVWLPQVTGNGYEAINLILGGQLALGTTLILLLAKALATTSSVSSGSPGGVFTPSLFLGAALGGAFGRAAALLGHGTPASIGGYALVGMAAMTAATTHAPVLAAVMIFELSGDYSIVVPLLISTAAAAVVSRRLRPTSVYMEELSRRGKGWEMTFEGRRMQAPRDEP
jgi:CIC family chloride channel protein